jgi:hypothetical protein
MLVYCNNNRLLMEKTWVQSWASLSEIRDGRRFFSQFYCFPLLIIIPPYSMLILSPPSLTKQHIIISLVRSYSGFISDSALSWSWSKGNLVSNRTVHGNTQRFSQVGPPVMCSTIQETTNCTLLGEISGSCGGEYEDNCLLGCCAVQSGSSLIALMI